MKTRLRLSTLGMLVTGATSIGRAQARIPIHAVAPPNGVTQEPIATLSGLRQLPDGRVLVNDSRAHRLMLFDSTLKTFSIVAADDAPGLTKYPAAPRGSLYSYLGDSTLLMDAAAYAFILIDPQGQVRRALAPVKPLDMVNVSLQYTGTPGFDSLGRFIYRARGTQGSQLAEGARAPNARDSVAIVRADFDRRAVDTIGTFSVPIAPQFSTTTDGSGKVHGLLKVNPIPTAADDWAVLSDGSVAVVRASDYHIDWIRPNGKMQSTPKMPFDWRRLTDDDKSARVDSMRRVIDSVSKAGKPYGMTIRSSTSEAGRTIDTIVPTVEFMSPTEMPDYVPAIRPGASKPDQDGNLWILPTTSLDAKDGLLYDVVNSQGLLFQRVQLPKGRAIAGFGRGGIVYLMFQQGQSAWNIERTHVVSSSAPGR